MCKPLLFCNFLDKFRNIVNCKVEQDKNNKEIYHGDIIQFDFDIVDNKSCVWKNHVYIWITKDLDVIMSYNHPYSENSDRLKEFIEEEFAKTNFYPQLVIIGNIYENPDL